MELVSTHRYGIAISYSLFGLIIVNLHVVSADPNHVESCLFISFLVYIVLRILDLICYDFYLGMVI